MVVLLHRLSRSKFDQSLQREALSGPYPDLMWLLVVQPWLLIAGSDQS